MDKTKDISTYNLTDGQTDRQRDHYIEMQTDSQSYRQAVFTQFHFPHNQIIYTPVQTGSGKQGNRETDGQTQRQVNNVSFFFQITLIDTNTCIPLPILALSYDSKKNNPDPFCINESVSYVHNTEKQH